MVFAIGAINANANSANANGTNADVQSVSGNSMDDDEQAID
jgi:hypothetical protein